MKAVAVIWFLAAIGLVVRTWLRLLYEVAADWVIDSIDWPGSA